MNTRIRSILTLASLSLCLSYLAGCSSSGDVWVKQSESTELPAAEPQEMANVAPEKIPAKTMKDSAGYE